MIDQTKHGLYHSAMSTAMFTGLSGLYSQSSFEASVVSALVLIGALAFFCGLCLKALKFYDSNKVLSMKTANEISIPICSGIIGFALTSGATPGTAFDPAPFGYGALLLLVALWVITAVVRKAAARNIEN